MRQRAKIKDALRLLIRWISARPWSFNTRLCLRPAFIVAARIASRLGTRGADPYGGPPHPEASKLTRRRRDHASVRRPRSAEARGSCSYPVKLQCTRSSHVNITLQAQSSFPHTRSPTMSVTTTSNTQTYNIRTVLADYDLHHTPATDPLDTTLNAHPSPNPLPQSNPADWPTNERRVPPYRPVNTELDHSQRRVYQNGIERTFITVMFSGVFLESVSGKFSGRVGSTN